MGQAAAADADFDSRRWWRWREVTAFWSRCTWQAAQVGSHSRPATLPLTSLSIPFPVHFFPIQSSAHLWEIHHFTVSCGRMLRRLSARENTRNGLMSGENWLLSCCFNISSTLYIHFLIDILRSSALLGRCSFFRSSQPITNMLQILVIILLKVDGSRTMYCCGDLQQLHTFLILFQVLKPFPQHHFHILKALFRHNFTSRL